MSARAMFRTLRYTPLRDVLRVRLTRLLDVSWLLENSDLPVEATALISKVVRKTRLWRLEKADVARELVAHFRDGLEAGRSIDDLLASFGDPVQSARLIRRAKIRNRPLLWHVARRSCQAVLVVVLIAVVFLLIYTLAALALSTRRPTVKVDYLAMINAPILAVPEEDRAWPIYRQARIEHNPEGFHQQFEQLIHGGPYTKGEAPGWRRVRPGNPKSGEVEALLDRGEGLLAQFRVAAAKPAMGRPVQSVRAEMAERRAKMGPEFRADDVEVDVTEAARLVAETIAIYGWAGLVEQRIVRDVIPCDMARAALRGDGARIVADYGAAVGYARQERQSLLAPVAYQYRAQRVLREPHEALMDLIAQSPEVFTNDQLAALSHLALRTEPLWKNDYRGEEMWLRDRIQRIYSDNGRGDGEITLTGLRILRDKLDPKDEVAMMRVMPIVAATFPSRREMSEQVSTLCRLLQAEADWPLWELLHRESSVKQLTDQWGQSRFAAEAYNDLQESASFARGSNARAREVRAMAETTTAAIALELYRRDHGQFPEALDQLVPRYLPTPPLDHSTGGSLRYKLAEGRPLLYGLGKDGIDDGGVWDGSTYWPNVPPSGDWVLYPPVAQITSETK